MSTVIDIRGLARSFGRVEAVRDLHLAVQRAEMFGLVGPDGAGKTTTMRMVCGILVPSAGTAVVLGHDIVRDPDAVKKRIGYLSQRFSLYGDLTVDENMEFFAEIHGVYAYKPRREELLSFTRLAPFRRRLAEQLSGGMRQKLALACTLIHEPEILFLDEPTTGVDPVSRRDFWRILQSLRERGMTIVMSTPYLDEAERCSRVGLMNRGVLMKVDTPATLKTLMQGEIVEIVCKPVRVAARLLQDVRDVHEVQAFGDRLHVVVPGAEAVLPAIRQLLRSNDIAMESERVISPSLENIFISLLTHKTLDGAAV